MIGYGQPVLLVHDPQTLYPRPAALLEQEGFAAVKETNHDRQTW